jgi:hypothetical protein
MLRMLLDAHSDLAIPAETAWFAPVARSRFHGEAHPHQVFCDVVCAMPTFADTGLDESAVRARIEELNPFDPGDALRALGTMYAQNHGKPRWGDKSPANVIAIPAIRALLPESRIVHLIRDVRDVVASFRGVWFRPAETVEGIATDWVVRVMAARASGVGHDWYMELRYEDLVEEPEHWLRRICTHAELEFQPAMLEAHRRAAGRLAELTAFRSDFGVTREQRISLHAPTTRPPSTDSVDRWRNDLTPGEVTRIESVAGHLRASLGYRD